MNEYYQVRDSWDNNGYRLYYGDDRFVSQINGEINGKVYRTIKAAQEACMRMFKHKAVRVFD